MKERLLRVLKFLAYPAFYVVCLALFGYLTFPFARLKDRIVAEFARRAKPGQRLEIDRVGSYWFTGIELEGVRLVLPKEEPKLPGLPLAAENSKDAVIAVDEAHARLRILPLLIGRLKLSFWMSGLGGEIKGVMPIAGSNGDIDVTIEGIEIGRVEPLVQAIGGVPIHGSASGSIQLSPENGKLSKGSGSVDLTIHDVVVSDGKTKIQGLIELPAARMGDLALTGEAKDGVLTVSKLGATGADIELVGAGKVGLHDNWQNSVADLFVRFKFTDAYRGKNDLTKGLFGAPGATGGGLLEMQVPKMKRAKRADGFFGFRAHGPLKRLSFDPTLADGPTPAGAASAASSSAPRHPGANSPFVHRGKTPPPILPGGTPRPVRPFALGSDRPVAGAAEAPAAAAPGAEPAPEPAAAEPAPAPPPEPAAPAPEAAPAPAPAEAGE